MNKLALLFISMLIAGCSGSKIINLAIQGELSKSEFNEEIPITYLDKQLFIDVAINGKTYSFLFDTGYDISTLDKSLLNQIKFSPLVKQKTTGSSFEDIKLLYGSMSSMTIGDIEFKNFGVGLQDLSHIKSPFSDGRKIYGIIGTNILRKGFWQINYQNQTVKFSNNIDNFKPPADAIRISMISKSPANWGINRIKISIDGVTENFVFDTGSYGNISANYSFLHRLKNTEKPLEKLSTSNQSEKEKFKIEELKIGSHEWSNQEILIEKDINMLIGNDFLEHFVVTIDWFQNILYLKPVDEKY